jgi:hypothetical protein
MGLFGHFTQDPLRRKSKDPLVRAQQSLLILRRFLQAVSEIGIERQICRHHTDLSMAECGLYHVFESNSLPPKIGLESRLRTAKFTQEILREGIAEWESIIGSMNGESK